MNDDESTEDDGVEGDGVEGDGVEVDGVVDDLEALRMLVQLAADGELSDTETDEVEALIADKPALQAEYDRRRVSPTPEMRTAPAPPPPGRAQNGTNGCVLGIVGFFVALVVMLVIGFLVMPRSNDGANDPLDPGGSSVGAVIEDPDQRALPLEGPRELTAKDRLALIYSERADAAVLLGADIPTDGELFEVTRPAEVLASFETGTVTVLIEDFDPGGSYGVRTSEE